MSNPVLIFIQAPWLAPHAFTKTDTPVGPVRVAFIIIWNSIETNISCVKENRFITTAVAAAAAAAAKKTEKRKKTDPQLEQKNKIESPTELVIPKLILKVDGIFFFFLELAFRVMFRRYRHRQFARRFEWLVLIGRSCQTSLVTAQVRALSVIPIEIGCSTRAEFEIVRPKRGRKTQFGNGFQSQLQGKKWK